MDIIWYGCSMERGGLERTLYALVSNRLLGWHEESVTMVNYADGRGQMFILNKLF